MSPIGDARLSVCVFSCWRQLLVHTGLRTHSISLAHPAAFVLASPSPSSSEAAVFTGRAPPTKAAASRFFSACIITPTSAWHAPPPHTVCVLRDMFLSGCPGHINCPLQRPSVVLPDRLMIAQNAWALGAPDLFPPVALNWGKDGSLHCASGPSMFSPAACPSPLRSHGGTQTNKCREYHSLRRRVPGPDELVVKGPYEGKRERSFGLGRSVGSRRGQCRWCDAVMCGLAFSRRWFSVSIRSQLKNAEQFWPPQRQRAQNTEHQTTHSTTHESFKRTAVAAA